jgi:hypothetical protein
LLVLQALASTVRPSSEEREKHCAYLYEVRT